MKEKKKNIDKHSDKILKDRKVPCSTRISPVMNKILLKNACSQNMDLSEYLRMIIALYTMDEIVEQEVIKMFKNSGFRKDSGYVKSQIDEKFKKLKHLKILPQWAEDEMQNLKDYSVKTKERYLSEIKVKQGEHND